MVTRRFGGFLLWLVVQTAVAQPPLPPEIPPVLQPWQSWALESGPDPQSIPLHDNPRERIGYWPSRLTVRAGSGGGEFSLNVVVMEETWVPLPGSPQVWPIDVTDGGDAAVVIQRSQRPMIRLPPGSHDIAGKFRWQAMPQRLMLPPEIGLLDLRINDESVAIPRWEADGQVWLRRTDGVSGEKDSLSVQVYRVIEDGIPLQLRTEIELTVSGKSREVELGSALPAGWILATIQSPLPVAVDQAGRLRAQVRAGKWTVELHAFRTDPAERIYFEPGAEPIVATELVALRSDPDLRVVQIDGIPLIDASQTTFPNKWRELPIYRWQTDTAFELKQQMRGTGRRGQEGLRITRQLWLDEDGRGATYEDSLRGAERRIWRLDAAAGQSLGSVRVDDEAQLITANPGSGGAGVEIRRRDFKLKAIGRTERIDRVPATGWLIDAQSLSWTLTMPPGWRALAVLGPDDVRGDWLSAWSLLDLFLLLIFSLAVRRLYGTAAGALALVTFALAYHEPASPRWTWLLLLIPVALLKVVPDGAAAGWLRVIKWAAAALLLIFLVPFVARQCQNVLYPQLEPAGYVYGQDWIFRTGSFGASRSGQTTALSAAVESGFERDDEMPAMNNPADRKGLAASSGGVSFGRASQSYNLAYDAKSKIQTGPARPQWDWNRVSCRWDGPVAAGQTVRPVLISAGVNRLLTAVRVGLLIMLAAVLLRRRGSPMPGSPRASSAASASASSVAAAGLIGVLMLSSPTWAQIPDPQILSKLRGRLLKPDPSELQAADIPSVDLTIDGNEIAMRVTVHATAPVAVPMPGPLPSWSPVSVTIDDDQPAAVIRRDGFLWVSVAAGIHQIRVTGRIPDAADWQWTYRLRPHRVSIDAEDWKVTGISPDGVPGDQVFFVRKQKVSADGAAYDREHFTPVFEVRRELELGLTWRVRTTVRRITEPGKAASLRVNLLPGERVLTAARNVIDGQVEVAMGSNVVTASWEGELPVGGTLRLAAAQTSDYVERHEATVSPVWHVTMAGLSPIYETDEADLIPVWQLWPGETVSLTLTRPAAVQGQTMTIQRVTHTTTLGRRQHADELELMIEPSLATDLRIDLEPGAEVTDVRRGKISLPVRQQDNQWFVATVPGEQTVRVRWKTDQSMQTIRSPAPVGLNVQASNVTRIINVPSDRWVLWAWGPRLGPAVRFWVILAVSVLAALVLGSFESSPIGRSQWVLLLIGLTQVPWPLAVVVVAWLFALSYRGREPLPGSSWRFNLMQLALIGLTAAALMVLVGVVARGLLGHPDMFILGNGSSRRSLRWFEPRTDGTLPSVHVVSVSVWYYRLAMLLWALWLAAALLRWLRWGWDQFSRGGVFRQPGWGPLQKLVQMRDQTPS